MTKQLSPEAQAVTDAACTLADLLNREVSQDEMLAAALEALADRVVPANGSRKNNEIRSEILAIAAELHNV